MQDLLNKVDTALNASESARPTPSEINRLAISLENQADATIQCLELPREILLRITQLVEIPRDFGVTTTGEQDLGDSTATLTERSNWFKALAIPLLRMSIPLVRISLPPTTDAAELDQSSLSLYTRVFLAVAKFLQPEFNNLFSCVELERLASRIVSSIVEPTSQIRFKTISHLLRSTLPNYFKPHPKLNPESGRLLSRPLGGPDHRGRDDEYGDIADTTTRESGWKGQVGLSGVVLKVLESIKTEEEVQELWPWLLPPLLAFLDDFTTTNRILGLLLLDQLLDTLLLLDSSSSPRPSSSSFASSLLSRTGVGKVFQQSLTVIYSNLSDPLSVKLQSIAQPVGLKLLNVLYPRPLVVPAPAPPPPTTPTTTTATTTTTITRIALLPPTKTKDDRDRFEALCKHFEQTTLSTWQYKSGHYELELLQLSRRPCSSPSSTTTTTPTGATTTTRTRTTTTTSTGSRSNLRDWITEIGIGVIRYLGILVPHLTGLIKGDDDDERVKGGGGGGGGGTWSTDMIELKLGAVRTLRELAKEGRGRSRVGGWEDLIVASVGKCWVEYVESKKTRLGKEEEDGGGEERFEQELKGMVKDFERVGNRPTRNYWAELKALDPIFEELFEASTSEE